MNNVIIVDENDLKKKISTFKKDGTEKMHVLSDFDRTLTQGLVDGKKLGSVIGQIRDGGYLTPDYPQKAKDLFAKYHPIEIDPNLSIEEKSVEMDKWWKEHFDLIVESGLDKKIIRQISIDRPLPFRDGFEKFSKILNENKIPLVIITASVGDMVFDYMANNKFNYDNVHVIGNNFEYDSSGKVIGVKPPIVHVFNKSEVTLKHLPIYNKLLARKNVLLLGDSLGDIGMIEGFEYNNLIKIGFLNEDVESNLKNYKKVYDVIIIGDGDFSYINELIEKIKS